ncbi:hypothetical protein SeMB42_g05179 [Synchytrium endobioticum]|uniref:Uncharacterized protein n=1 Tax=Synchytrium endobioticum TaxID=286115 RepID=A0A507CT85_9FUNG|nr:hypothetical protein SeMB42_g05179 [Synchytrium endobioticum]
MEDMYVHCLPKFNWTQWENTGLWRVYAGQDTADLAARVTTQNQDNRARDRDDAVSSMEAIVHSRSTLVELNRMDENLDAVSRDLAALVERLQANRVGDRADANLAGASAPGRSTNWLFRGVAENDEEQRLGRAEIYRKAAALQAQHAAHLPGASARANSQD